MAKSRSFTASSSSASGSPTKRFFPKKFTSSPPNSPKKTSTDQIVHVICGRPGYALAYIVKPNGDVGFYHPFTKKIHEEDPTVLSLNIVAVVNRVQEGTENLVTQNGYPAKQFLTYIGDDEHASLLIKAEEWGRNITASLNACEFKYSTSFVFGGDTSGPGGKDLKEVMARHEIINKFFKVVYEEFLDQPEFFDAQELMETMFHDTSPDVLRNIV